MGEERTPTGDMPTLLVWDYDWSLVNDNSDTWIVKQLAPQFYAHFRDERHQGWTELMNQQFERLHGAGLGREAILSCIASVPVFQANLDAIRGAGAAGAKQLVLSDANTVFIEAFMQKHGIRELFDEILTNPAEFDEHERLIVRPYHTPPPHKCPLCPPNLCKGMVLEAVRARLGEPHRVIYVGDGGGDFCPACDLAPGDAVLCRADPSPPLTHFGLQQRLDKSLAPGFDKVTRRGELARVTAEVHHWHDGDELARTISQLLDSAPISTSEVGKKGAL